MRPRTALGRLSALFTSSGASRWGNRTRVAAPAPSRFPPRSHAVSTTAPAPDQPVVASTTAKRGQSHSISPARAKTRPPSAYVAPRLPPARSRQNSRSGSQVSTSRTLVSSAPSRRGSQARSRNAPPAPSAVSELSDYESAAESTANSRSYRSAPYPSCDRMPVSPDDSDSAAEPRLRTRRSRGATRQPSATRASVAPPRRAATAPAASASTKPPIRRKPVPVRASTTPAAIPAPASSRPPVWWREPESPPTRWREPLLPSSGRQPVPPPGWSMPVPVRASTAPAPFPASASSRPPVWWRESVPPRWREPMSSLTWWREPIYVRANSTLVSHWWRDTYEATKSNAYAEACPDGSDCPEDCPWHPRTPYSWGKWEHFINRPSGGWERYAMRCLIPAAALAISLSEWMAMPPFPRDLYSNHGRFGREPLYYLDPIEYNASQREWEASLELFGGGSGGWLILESLNYYWMC